MTVTTARQPAPDVDEEMTTADWAGMVATGKWGKPSQRPTAESDNTANPTVPDDGASRAASANTTSEAPAKAPKSKPQREQAASDHDEEAPRRSYLMESASWTPADYTAISAASLREAVAEHSSRSQAMDGALARGLYGVYAAPASAIGVALNIVSWTTAKLSALLNDPRHAQRPGSLHDTIALHTERAHNIPFTPVKVLYSGYAVPAIAISVLLNAVAWLAAHAAVALNVPRSLGRVVLGLLFISLIVGGTSVML